MKLEAVEFRSTINRVLANDKAKLIITALSVVIAFTATAAAPFLYAKVANVRDWCYVPYIGTTRETARETAIVSSLFLMSALFLYTTVSSLRRSRNIMINILLFSCSYLLIVVVFSMYFYTFGITVTEVGSKRLSLETGAIVRNMGDYIYFSLSNSIFLTPQEFDACPSLRLAVVLQRVASLFVAFAAGLVGGRITKLID
ncbi:hypothetical protein [Shinella sp. G-2]|uniref:hypothetical protein n=1 Tax=Shinella sp. G-2 TaxID=3133141 RepID=UPI003CFD302D